MKSLFKIKYNYLFHALISVILLVIELYSAKKNIQFCDVQLFNKTIRIKLQIGRKLIKN